MTNSTGPWEWAVVWGSPFKGRMRRVTVTAYDVDGALLEAAQLHPEWERPRTAFIVDGPQLPSDAFTVE